MTLSAHRQTDRPSLQADQMVRLFNACFSESEQTLLIGGASEPYYAPQSNRQAYHHIFFVHDYVRSSLHEIAHWMCAGKVRRQLPDYGYWYAPDGRTSEQQAAFEAVEVAPQAIEWLLSLAAGVSFEVSLDNLSTEVVIDRVDFTARVLNYALERWHTALPPRTEIFLKPLLAASGQRRWMGAQLYQAAADLIHTEKQRAERMGIAVNRHSELRERTLNCA